MKSIFEVVFSYCSKKMRESSKNRFPVLYLEAVKRFFGDNVYALRRVKDAANALGVRERHDLKSGVAGSE